MGCNEWKKLNGMEFMRQILKWLKDGGLGRQVGMGILFLTVLGLWIFVLDVGGDWRNAVPERLADGKSVNVRHMVKTYCYWGALAAGVLGLILLASAGWWMKTGREEKLRLVKISAKTFWIPLLVIVVGAGWLRYDRLDLSVDADEVYVLRRYMQGGWEMDEQKRPQFEQVEWMETVFGNRSASNHFMFTVPSRALLALGGYGEDGKFSETLYRLPAYLAGLGSIVLAAIFLWVMGYPRAGLIAALLLAFHPWHIRYSTEGVGYIFPGVFGVGAMILLVLAWRTGRWRYWLGYGFANFGLMWSVVGAGWLLLTVNILIALALVVRRNVDDGVDNRGRRWLASLGFGLMPTFVLLAPAIPQIQRYLIADRIPLPMGKEWFLKVLGYLNYGVAWRGVEFDSPLIRTVELMAQSNILVLILGAVILPLCFLGGLGRVLKNGNYIGKLVMVGAVVSILLLWVVANSRESYLLMRYVSFFLPWYILLIAVGVDWVGDIVRRVSPLPASAMGVGIILVFLYAWVVTPQIAIIQKHSKENLKNVSLAIHGDKDPFEIPANEVRRLNFWSSISRYDPWSRNTPVPEEIRKEIAEARALGIPLYMTFGHRDRAVNGGEDFVREAVFLVEDDAVFELVETFYGLDEDQFTHYLYRLRPE